MDEAAAPSAAVRISRAVAVGATLALIGLGLSLWRDQRGAAAHPAGTTRTAPARPAVPVR